MGRDTKKRAKPIRWRLWFSIAGLFALGVSTAMAGLKVRQYALTDPQFTFSRNTPDALSIQGLQFASRSKVLRTFSQDFEHSVFSIPLGERRRRLLAIDWIRDATVSRIWPDRLVVHVTERTPVAFVFFRSGVLLIDSQGVLLDQPPQSQFTFPVLSGVTESDSDEQRRDRVRAFLRVEKDLGYLAKDISEINAADPDSIRIVAQVDKTPVELLVGDANFGWRYQNFLTHYPEIKKRSPELRLFDLRLDDRITGKVKD